MKKEPVHPDDFKVQPVGWSLRGLYLQGIFICLVGVFLIGWKWFDDEQENRAFRDQGVVTLAEIVQKERVTRNDGGTSYRLTMQYVDGGRANRFQQFVLEHTFDSVSEGSTIEIEYLPGYLDSPRLHGEPKELDNPLYIMLIVGVFGVGFALLYFRDRAKARGMPTPA